MAIITKVRGDRLRIRQCLRQVTVFAPFEPSYPVNPTGLFYHSSTNTIAVADVHHTDPSFISPGAIGSQPIFYDAEQDFLYYTEGGLQRVHPDGTGVEGVTGYPAWGNDLFDIIFDPTDSESRRIVVWGAPTSFDVRISTGKLPEAGVNNFTEATHQLTIAVGSGGFTFGGITIDVEREVYYASQDNPSLSRIYSIPWGFSSFDQIYQASGGTFPRIRDLAYDPVTDKIYFLKGSANGDSLLKSINPDGTGDTTLHNFGPIGVNFIEINIGGRYLLILSVDDLMEFSMTGVLLSTLASEGAEDAFQGRVKLMY